jgi:hypothetical protein
MRPGDAAVGLVRRVAEGLREGLQDPRRLAQELIGEQFGTSGPFLGEGMTDCPWIVFNAAAQFYAL